MKNNIITTSKINLHKKTLDIKPHDSALSQNIAKMLRSWCYKIRTLKPLICDKINEK